jgi:hypothetical protein|tara:strand:- start:6218 stop:6994 length:777 start_codon:yes stop_codon:yes gene_type:complete
MSQYIDKRKILYAKPKSLARELVQKLFLKLLFKLFPKKSSLYKNKIKTIMNKSAFYIYRYSVVVYLRLRHPLYYGLPSSQLYALHMTIKFMEILKGQKIDFFLLGGTLLGAVRQESFAGKPSDIDLGIREEHLQKLSEAFPLLIKYGVKNIKENIEGNRIQILFPCILIDISIYKKKIIEGKEIWIGEIEHLNNKSTVCTFSVMDLEKLTPIQVYGKEFLAPTNPEIYLEKVYGKNWKIPDKRQFFWNKNKTQQSKTQ